MTDHPQSLFAELPTASVERDADRAEPLAALLAADEPRPAEIFNPEGRAPVLLLCDHASNFVPRALLCERGRALGLDPAELERHIAYDIGIASVTRAMAEALDAPAVMSHFSRLIVDPNRQLDDPTLIPEIADGSVVPMNRGLSREAVAARLESFFHPYHALVREGLDRLSQRGPAPVVISMHSFTPIMRGRRRPWEVGILWNRDPRVPVPMIEALAARGWTVGDNEPYSGRDAHGYTTHVHADARGLANVLVELRQDLIDTRQGQAKWTGEMLAILEPILAEPSVYGIEHH